MMQKALFKQFGKPLKGISEDDFTEEDDQFYHHSSTTAGKSGCQQRVIGSLVEDFQNMNLRDVQKVVRNRIKQERRSGTGSVTNSQAPPLRKSYVASNQGLINQIKEQSVSRVAEDRKQKKTLFGRDVGWSERQCDQVDEDANKGKSLHYFRKNHLQKACKIAGEVGGEDERPVQINQKKMNGKTKKKAEEEMGPSAQFARMSDKIRRRVNLSECMAKVIPEPFLKSSPQHPLGHPYSFNEEMYLNQIPIPRELTEQIEKSKPKDNVQSLLKLPSKLYTYYVKITEKWMANHCKQSLEQFIKAQSDVDFAKELFKTWDDDNSGKLDLEELTLPLTALGLINDMSMAKKLLQSLKGKK